jgi:hypothetical protein
MCICNISFISSQCRAVVWALLTAINLPPPAPPLPHPCCSGWQHLRGDVDDQEPSRHTSLITHLVFVSPGVKPHPSVATDDGAAAPTYSCVTSWLPRPRRVFFEQADRTFILNQPALFTSENIHTRKYILGCSTGIRPARVRLLPTPRRKSLKVP